MPQGSGTARSGALGVVAGLVGSLCCLGPSAAVLLGLGSSSALAGLAFERVPALAAGFAVVVAGLIVGWRTARVCPAPSHVRWHQPALLLISFALAYGLLGFLLPAAAAREADRETAAAQAQAPAGVPATAPRRLTLTIAKMYCPPCASGVRGKLARKPGVRSFVAEAGNEQVVVDYEPGQVSAQQILAMFPSSFGVTQLSDQALH